MSSNIPTRRATRATRLQDENTVKGKPLATRGLKKTGTTTAAGSSKATTTLEVSTQHKRKREALGEVTNNNKNKNLPKALAKDGKLSKPQVVISTKASRPTTARPAAARKTKNSIDTAALKEEEEVQGQDQDDAMAVDEPAEVHTLRHVPRRISTRTVSASTGTTTAGVQTRRVSHLKKTASVTGTGRSTHAVVVETEEQVDEEDDEAYRASKRRRTSSEADDEEAIVEVEEEVAAAEEEKLVEAVPEDEYALEAEEEEEEITGWEDLDKEDAGDPAMVSEYVIDIFKYLAECEEQTLPNPNYMRHQGELRWSQRAELMDYIIGLHQRFRLTPETLYLAVNLIDRFLSMRVVSLSKLQLVGVSCLFIASKFEEIVAPSVQHYLVATGLKDEIGDDEMLKAEKYILKTLNWTVSLFPQPLNWLRRISKADDYDVHVRTLAKFFLEIHVVERRLLGIKPSLIAAASIWLGRLVMNETEWTPNLAHYSGYTEKKILPIASIMINYCLRPDKHENFVQKYASKKFSKVSVYIDDWVTSRWNVGDKVSLADELAYLHALAIERSQGLP